MRLTLRTLLAYLDNTLDPQDAEALRQKLTESSFATQLVQRIRATLSNQMLAAPSPDAMGPIEDANAISEYLDSTLSHEQVAEIERACLESDPHLAEAAACHQILTMVLGTPANVPPQLRQRIYELPDRQLEQIASGDRFASLAIPVERPASVWTDDVPTTDATLVRDQAIEPVGVADSGVSDAPTRLREMEVANDSAGSPAKGGRLPAVIAGSKPRSITDADIYGGSIRTSRIAPWLVSLAVAGVILFALSRIFAPLLSPDRQIADANFLAETEVPAADSPPMVDISPDNTDATTASNPAAGESNREDPSVEKLPAPEPERTSTASVDPVVASPVTPLTLDKAELQQQTPKPASANGAEPNAVTSEPPMIDSSPAAAPVVGDQQPADAPPTDEELAESDPDAAAMDDPSTVEALVPVVREPIGQVAGSPTLIAAEIGEQWSLLNRGAPIESNSTVICGPTFRAEVVTTDQWIATLIGPARVKWSSDAEQNLTFRLESGRILLSPGKADAAVDLVLAGQPVRVSFVDAAHVVAIAVDHFRQPGSDFLIQDNRTPVRTITTIQGSVAVSGVGEHTLETGQQWIMRANEPSTVTDIDPNPTWVMPPDSSDLSLEANARKGLLDLLGEREQPLEMALREATGFRRSEVAALAGQTLLALGRGDVYFDGAGILNQPKQRAYWPDHFLALQNAINQGVSYASNLKDSILRMDSANGQAIIRLLTGYSQQQLEDGGDKELVAMLDSPSMAVRVLALENLRQIMGTTLYFRAEEDNAVRRAPGIKKWIARQEKGDIRWPQ